jgi:Tfp pilus assembly protein PilO
MNQILLEIVRQKKIVILAVLVLLVINVALMVVIASYQEPELETTKSRRNELRNLVARAGKADAAALYRQGAADLEKLNSRIPLKREFARVLSDIIEIASDSGVTTGAISYKPVPIKDEALLSYQLSFPVGGDYASVKSCLSDLQRHPELLVVDGVTLSNNDIFEEKVVMNLNITVYLRVGA